MSVRMLYRFFPALAVGLMVVVGLAGASPLAAATYRVTHLSDASILGGCSFREAIRLHNDPVVKSNPCGVPDKLADTIEFAPGLFGVLFLDSRQGEIVIRAPALKITGTGRSNLTIDGGGAMSVLVLDRDAPPVLTLSGLTIRHGKGRPPAGSWDPQGGGLRMEVGGDIPAQPTTVTISDCAFVSNLVDWTTGLGRGAAVTTQGTLIVRRTRFLSNRSGWSAVSHWGDAQIEDSEFRDNWSQNQVSALEFDGRGRWVVERCLFRENTVQVLGASAIYFWGGGDATVTNSTFYRNASPSGIVIGGTGSPLALTNSTLFGNTAEVASNGVIRVTGSMATVVSNLFSENEAREWDASTSSTGSRWTASYNLFTSSGSLLPGALCAPTTAGGANLCGVTNAYLNPLADNGGQTWTMGLGFGSRALDQGANPRFVLSDQRGFGYARSAHGKVDIGAYEWQ